MKYYVTEKTGSGFFYDYGTKNRLLMLDSRYLSEKALLI